MQEMREEFERSSKSAIELAEGTRADEAIALPPAPSGDVTHWRFDFDGHFVGMIRVTLPSFIHFYYNFLY